MVLIARKREKSWEGGNIVAKSVRGSLGIGVLTRDIECHVTGQVEVKECLVYLLFLLITGIHIYKYPT